MKISIITPTFNSEQFLNYTLKSIKSQNYKNIEHIFIDNKSTDKTIDILERYKKKTNYKVIINSSKDKGIYHAFNKGLKMASGDLITIINSDDFITGKNYINEVVKKFKVKKLDFFYGNVRIVQRNNIKKTVRIWKSSIIKNEDYFKVPHPSFFIKKKFMKKYKIKFDTKYNIASDLDFIINCFKKSKNFFHFDKILICQRSGGTSQKFFNIFKANYEVYKIIKTHKLCYKLFFILNKIFFKICQVKLI